MKCFRRATHVIFDLDGTLLDTEPIYEKLYADLIERHGQTIPPALMLKFRGAPAEFALQLLINELGLRVSLDELHREYRELQLDRLASTKLMRGAERIIKHFHKHNVPMAIATASRPK
jgi:pseudouridine 5'-phosphatase